MRFESNRGETTRMTSGKVQGVHRPGQSERKNEQGRDKEGDEEDLPQSMSQAIERAFNCLQLFNGELNIGNRIKELSTKLTRKEKKRQEESVYKTGLEEKIKELEQDDQKESNKAKTRIQNLKNEAAKKAAEGDHEQAQSLRSEACDDAIREREREDITQDEIRRLHLEVRMLTEEINTYDTQIDEVSRESSMARQLQQTLLNRTDVSPPPLHVKRKREEEKGGEKKLKGPESLENVTHEEPEELNYEC